MSNAPFIHPQSSLALIAAIVAVLRWRFAAPNPTPWEWTGSANDSSLFIYSQYDRESEATNLVPKLVVGRGPIANNRVAIGDEDAAQPVLLTKGGKYFHQLATCAMSVQCIAETNGESDYLSDLVQATIAGAEELIAKIFTLRQISPLLQQPTRPYDRDKEKWSTEVEFRIDLERRSFTLPNALPLRSYSLDIEFQAVVDQIVLRIIEGKASLGD